MTTPNAGRMWRNGNPPLIAVGTHKGRASMEGGLAVSYKWKHNLPMRSCTQAPILPSEVERKASLEQLSLTLERRLLKRAYGNKKVISDGEVWWTESTEQWKHSIGDCDSSSCQATVTAVHACSHLPKSIDSVHQKWRLRPTSVRVMRDASVCAPKCKNCTSPAWWRC